MQTITPFLMLDNQAEEAVNFYLSVFKDAAILGVSRFGEQELKVLERLPAELRPGPAGQVKVITFRLNGQTYYAGNGGPYFKFSEGLSLYVRCDTQAEIDELWEKLSAGGQQGECGWLRDRFGVSWQIAPAILDEMMNDPDQEKSQRVMVAVLNSKKLDIETLKKAFAG